MNFYIIAIDHGWQLVPHGIETPEIVAARAQFEALLGGALAGQHFDLICEESDPCRLSIAQRMAYDHNPRIP